MVAMADKRTRFTPDMGATTPAFRSVIAAFIILSIFSVIYYADAISDTSSPAANAESEQ